MEECAHNLRQLGLALHMESNNVFARNLQELESYLKNPNILRCPCATDHDVPLNDFKEAETRGGRISTSRVYPKGTHQRGSTPLMSPRTTRQGRFKGGNILFVGGYVHWKRFDPKEPGEGFWDVLESNGITKEIVENGDEPNYPRGRF